MSKTTFNHALNLKIFECLASIISPQEKNCLWSWIVTLHLGLIICHEWLFVSACVFAGLTWPLRTCSWGRRRRSSGWRPPDWSHPPPRSGRSPWSWRTHKWKHHSTLAAIPCDSVHRNTWLTQQNYNKRHKWQTNRPIMHIHFILQITTEPDFLAVTNFQRDSSRLLPNKETEEMRLKTN